MYRYFVIGLVKFSLVGQLLKLGLMTGEVCCALNNYNEIHNIIHD